MNYKKLVSLSLAIAVCMGVNIPMAAAEKYNDFDFITSHVNLKRLSGLQITRPEKSDSGKNQISTSGNSYFITGASDPNAQLYMNGNPIAVRGAQGSFGVLVLLKEGENEFRFTQDGSNEIVPVAITRGASTVTTINNLRSPVPDFDCAAFSGDTINLSCTAPSGASVTATVGGRKVALKQAAATAVPGVPARFSAKTTAGTVKGTQNLGVVTYTMNYNGKTSELKSTGNVFITGKGSTLIVRVKNTAASIYKDEARSAFIETAKNGAVDSVAEISDSLYRLSSGGWITKDSVQPLDKNVAIHNKVSKISRAYPDTGRVSGEYYILSGTANPMFRAYMDQNRLFVRLFHTSGVENTGDWAADSELFSEVTVTTEGDDTLLQFTKSGNRKLWGYDISYDNGVTTIFAKYAPTISSKGKPLSGTVIAVDAGHGGIDPGAIGIPGTQGAMEKDVTFASAVAVQKRLESLGAQVILCRTGDDDVTINDRMDLTRKYTADLFISLHCNSMGYEQDSNKPQGTESYYFEPISQPLATALTANVAGYTGRTNRGAKQSNYRVTLNAFAPSVLLEMGFLTNPAEYDSMTSRNGIYNTANAVGDSVCAILSQYAQ